MPNEPPRTRQKPEPVSYAAFLRKINVGRAKRVAMADLLAAETQDFLSTFHGRWGEALGKPGGTRGNGARFGRAPRGHAPAPSGRLG